MSQYPMHINVISRECMRRLCNLLNYIKLIENINCLNGLPIIRTKHGNKLPKYGTNKSKKILLSYTINLFPEI